MKTLTSSYQSQSQPIFGSLRIELDDNQDDADGLLAPKVKLLKYPSIA